MNRNKLLQLADKPAGRAARFFAFAMSAMLAGGAVAGAAPPPPPPATKVCPNGETVLLGSVCSAGPVTSQAGATGATLSNVMLDIGNTISGMLGDSVGGSGGVATSGVQRFALTGERSGQAAAPGGANWNAWLALSQVNVGYSFQPLQSGGRVDLGLGGLDYTFDNRLVVGLALSGERTRIDTSYNGGKLSGNGSTVVPYLGWRISNAYLLDASIGVGSTNLNYTDNSVAGGITGSNKDKRSLATVGLSYNTAMGNWRFTGKGSLLSVENRFSGFNQSNGLFVSGVSTRTTQARLGAQAAYNAGNLTPFFGVVYINDLQRSDQAPVAGQSAANDRDGFQIRAGLNLRSSGALYGGVVLMSEVGRSQVRNDQVLVNLGLRF